MQKKALFFFVCLTLLCFLSLAFAQEAVIEPAYPVPEEIQWLLKIAEGELGYTEEAHGYTKYGAWSGDPYAQWCAEFLCWCVNQVDEQYGTQLLNVQYPLYSSSNVGRRWFIRQGRYVVRNGHLENWGYQWLKGEHAFLTTGSYIPQPGDWVFFTWTSNDDTDHVAMVEYCTRNTQTGDVSIHVIEGNTPDRVKRTTYALTYTRILGFGTVHDVCEYTMRSGNTGEKVRMLQEKLAYLDYLTEDAVDGIYGSKTAEAIRVLQEAEGIKVSGIANMETQYALARACERKENADPSTWLVEDDDTPLTLDQGFSWSSPKQDFEDELDDVL